MEKYGTNVEAERKIGEAKVSEVEQTLAELDQMMKNPETSIQELVSTANKAGLRLCFNVEASECEDGSHCGNGCKDLHATHQGENI